MRPTFGFLLAATLVVGTGCSSTTTLADPDSTTGGNGAGGNSSGGQANGGQSSRSDAQGGLATGGGASDGGSAGDSSGDDLCTTYCEALEAGCTGEFEQFVSRATCMGFCSHLPPGNPSDEIGNSVRCRLNQAEIASAVAEPEVHCVQAGPGGNGTCGGNCEAYCGVLEQVCGARFDDEFVGQADCNTQCLELEDGRNFSTSINSGPTIQCRLWHTSAASVDPSTHCGHAVGESPCR